MYLEKRTRKKERKPQQSISNIPSGSAALKTHFHMELQSNLHLYLQGVLKNTLLRWKNFKDCFQIEF